MPPDPAPDFLTTERTRMVQEQLHSRGIRDERVLQAMGRVPRHEFVPPDAVHAAYDDHPIAIGEGQTISQPYMVASMLEALELRPADTVLEVGTGSGYQAALLAELAAEVFTIERWASLASRAQQVLAHLNYANIIVVTGDGSEGLRQYAPYDAIVVAAASPQVPAALIEQLRDGGRLVAPVGNLEEQELQVIRKTATGPRLERRYPCKFVPLIGKQGFPGL